MKTAVILHLGGDAARAHAAVEIYRELATLVDCRILVSSEGQLAQARAIYDAAGIPRARVIYDWSAWDTASNFTHTLRRIMLVKPVFVVVVTGARHLPRAMAIAKIVYDGRDTEVRQLGAQDSIDYRERWGRLVTDVARTTVWRLTGWLPTNPLQRWRARKSIAQAMRAAA